jgi:ribonuclease HI
MSGDFQTRFDIGLAMLAEPLQPRAEALARYVKKWKQRDTDIATWLGLAFDAAFVGDHDAAEQCVARAETIAAAKPDPADPAPATEAKPPRLPTVPQALAKGLSGTVPVPRPGQLVVATDGSHFRRWHGWGFVSTAGAWGCAADRFRGAAAGPYARPASLYAELRGAAMAAGQVHGPAVVLTDSLDAIAVLNQWRAGRTGYMPTGYGMRPDTDDGQYWQATLKDLAAAVAKRPDFTYQHVPGHTGHLLNETADALAKMARKRLSGELDGTAAELTARADFLVAGFLVAWHGMQEAG